jgi:hypothetical protein
MNNVEEWEVKGHGCWPSLNPPPNSPYFSREFHSQWVFWPRRGGWEKSHEIIVTKDYRNETLSPIQSWFSHLDFQGK